MNAIRRYELRARPRVTSPQLLITRRGEPYKTWGLDSVMNRIRERVGFHVHAHAFRHTRASAMVSFGSSLEHVRSFIGHTTTLHRYVRLATERDLGDLDRWAQLIPPPAQARPRSCAGLSGLAIGISVKRWKLYTRHDCPAPPALVMTLRSASGTSMVRASFPTVPRVGCRRFPARNRFKRVLKRAKRQCHWVERGVRQ
jgi:hypothetical protein